VSRRRIDLFVCHTFGNQLSQHLLYSFAGRWIGRHRRALERGLNVPDGIAISADGRWLAISNHRTHSVLMFDASRRLSANTRKLGELLGAGYPHGIRFSPDGRTLYVADAGAPVVRQYHAEAGDWHGTRESSGVARILDEQTFLAGRYNPEEGGPKGIDIDAIASVMVASSEMQPLAFFAMEDLFADTRSAAQETGRVLPAHIPAA
jgi:DNA-binding beta-propeller fold protein YncE